MVPLFTRLVCFIAFLWQIQILAAESSPTTCDSQNCSLPDCLCMSTTAPGDLNPQEIPQMVFLTFDDAVADVMYPTYQRILRNRFNPNGCNIGVTFFVTHEGTNYRLVNELFNRGNEIASHTVTHKMDYDYWKNTSVHFWQREISYQRHLLQSYGNIPFEKIQGFRAPFLQTGGDSTFTALRTLGLSYDSSLTTIQYMDPPIWPFTMDYGAIDECRIPPCGQEKHPGLWNIPMVEFRSDENGFPCKMADTCFPPYINRPDNPEASNLTADEIFNYFMFNFDRFNKNRAPFGVHQHLYWFLNNEPILEGFLQFLDHLATLDYVYIVPISKGIEWMKNPMTLLQVKTSDDVFGCDAHTSKSSVTTCTKPQVCYYTKSVPGGARFMGTCSPCPAEYPWLPDQYDPLLTTTTIPTTTQTTSPAYTSTLPNNSATNNNLLMHLLLILQGILLSFLHLFC